MSENAIQTQNLCVNLGEFHLQGIDLFVQKGEYFVILGPTGSGKTVLLETLSGLNRISTGKILLFGKDITNLEPEKRGFGFVYQDYALFPHLNLFENIAYGLKLRHLKKEIIRNKVVETSRLLGIEHLLNRRPAALSGGEQQRAALARSLVIDPAVLLLDEPLSALDPSTKEELQKELSGIHSRLGTTILHVTHDFEEALTLAQRIAVFRDGKIVQTGAAEDIFRKPANSFVAEFVGMRNIFSGFITHNTEGDKILKTSGLKIQVVTEEEGQRHATIRPEDILLSSQPIASSARNLFKGKIKEISDRGAYAFVSVECGILLSCMVTRNSIEELHLQPGQEVWLAFKASAVHVF